MMLCVIFNDQKHTITYDIKDAEELKKVYAEVNETWSRQSPPDHQYVWFGYDGGKRIGMINLSMVMYIETLP